MNKIKFADGTTFEIKDDITIECIRVALNGYEEMAPIETAITKAGNLDKVTLIRVDEGNQDIVIGEYSNMKLALPMFHNVNRDEDNKIEIVFTLIQKSEVEMRLEALETSTAITDGAVSDLAEMVGTMAEGGTV